MREDGIVVKIDGQNALVEVNCEGCKSCAAKAFCSGGDKRVLTVQNKSGVKLGDKVEIEIPRRSFYTSLSLVFIIPIILLFGGFLVFNHLLGDVISGLIGLGLLVGWFVVLKQIDKKQKKRINFIPKIISVYDHST